MRSLLVVAMLVLSACRVADGSAAAPSVQRPRISRDTRTAAPGTLEAEAGLVYDFGDGHSLPGALRFGATPATELVLAGDVYREDEAREERGFGDLIVGFRHRLWDEQDGAPALAIQLLTKVPIADADEGLGSGEMDLYAAAVADRSVSDTRLSAFGQLGLLGDRGGDGTDAELTLALAAARPLEAVVSGFGELALVHSPERDFDALFLGGGVYYRMTPHTVVDAGVRLGLADGEDFVLLIGITHNIGASYWVP